MKPEKINQRSVTGSDNVARPQNRNKHQAGGLAANDECYEPTLSEIFHDEIDAWARHAMSNNGFG